MTVSRLRFLDMVPWVRRNVEDSIERLGDGGLEILNLVIAKPNIPSDIARNYKQGLCRYKGSHPKKKICFFFFFLLISP